MDEYIIKKTDPNNGSFIIKSYTTNGPINPNSTTLHEHAVSANTSLVLLGKGTFDYGEPLQTNLINMLENFASDMSPTFPIKGQLWYDTSLNTPILKVFNGSDWTYAASNIDSTVNSVVSANKRIVKKINKYTVNNIINNSFQIPLSALVDIKVGSVIQLYEEELFDHDLGVVVTITAINAISGIITTNTTIPTNINRMVPLTIFLPFEYIPDKQELQVSLNGISLFNHVKGFDILYLPLSTALTDQITPMINYTEYNCNVTANSIVYPINIIRNQQNIYNVTGFEINLNNTLQNIEVDNQVILVNNQTPEILIKINGVLDITSNSTDSLNKISIEHIEYDSISDRTTIFFNEIVTLSNSPISQDGTIIVNYPYTYEHLIQDVNNELNNIGHMVFNNTNPPQLVLYGNPLLNITDITLSNGTNDNLSDPIRSNLITTIGSILTTDQQTANLCDYNEDFSLTAMSNSITINKSRLAGHTLEIIYTA